MTKEEALKKLQAIKSYMTSGNPMWSVEPVGEAMDMAIEALEQSQWIPCSERLPSEGQECFGTDEYGQIRHVFKDKCGESEFATVEEYMHIKIVAWMPLPEPYKGGDE